MVYLLLLLRDRTTGQPVAFVFLDEPAGGLTLDKWLPVVAELSRFYPNASWETSTYSEKARSTLLERYAL